MSEGIPTPESKDLRDLAQIIQSVASSHHGYSMVYAIVQNCCDHISAKARIMEVEHKMRIHNRDYDNV